MLLRVSGYFKPGIWIKQFEFKEVLSPNPSGQAGGEFGQVL